MNIKTRIRELADKGSLVEFSNLSVKSEAVREFAVGDQILKLGFKAANARGVYRPEALAMAEQLHGPILATALTKKGGALNKAQRKASAYQIREYRGVLRRGKERAKELAAKAEAVTEFARGDYAISFLKNALQSMKGKHPPTWAASRHPVPISTRGYEYYKDLVPYPNPVQESLKFTGAIKKPSKPQIDLIGSHPIFSGQNRANPIRKDVAKLIKEIKSNKTPAPLSDAAYAQAGIKRPFGLSLGTDPERAGRLMR